MIRLPISIFGVCFFLFFTFSFATPEDAITFWTTEVESDRLNVQKAMSEKFNAETGIAVNIVPVQENLLREKVTAAYAAKSLPDVLFHPIDFTIQWAEANILNVQAATKVVLRLGSRTFGQGPLNLVRFSSSYAAVPIDGWGQLLLYRKDLFKKNNLPVPNTWQNILKAAQALHHPPLMWGIEVATDPGQIYTQQVYEHFALSNGVNLVDTSGEISLDTPLMIETLEFYKSLSRFGPPGNIHWIHTRLDYLSGRAAMIIWSPYILDELSGLRHDQPVIPDIKNQQKGFLAENTGFVAIIHGPNASAQYGQINCLGITTDANRDKAEKWVEFMLTEGYLKWLSMAPEGKIPMRKGTPEMPNRFVEEWAQLEYGTTVRAKISDCFGKDTVKTILSGVDGFDRWGFSQHQGGLIAKVYGTRVIIKILKRFLDEEISAQQAAKMMNVKVNDLTQ